MSDTELSLHRSKQYR